MGGRRLTFTHNLRNYCIRTITAASFSRQAVVDPSRHPAHAFDRPDQLDAAVLAPVGQLGVDPAMPAGLVGISKGLADQYHQVHASAHGSRGGAFPEGVGFPGAAQIFRIRRDVLGAVGERLSRETTPTPTRVRYLSVWRGALTSTVVR